MEQITTNQKTALLVMDVQGATIKMLKDNALFINTVAKVIQKAHDNKMPVIYAVVGFRKGFPEVSPNNKSFLQLKNGAMGLDTEEATYIWHFDREADNFIECIRQIDSAITQLRSEGRQAYLDSKPENFSRILHDYSDPKKGFVLWKGQFDEKTI